jgi:hypothetical protein
MPSQNRGTRSNFAPCVASSYAARYERRRTADFSSISRAIDGADHGTRREDDPRGSPAGRALE